MSEPIIVSKRAIDVTPYNHAIWCSVGGGEPFCNSIVNRGWSEDGTKIVAMLDSHNFQFWHPDEMADVVETEPIYGKELFDKCMAEDREKMSKRKTTHPCQ